MPDVGIEEEKSEEELTMGSKSVRRRSIMLPI